MRAPTFTQPTAEVPQEVAFPTTAKKVTGAHLRLRHRCPYSHCCRATEDHDAAPSATRHHHHTKQRPQHHLPQSTPVVIPSPPASPSMYAFTTTHTTTTTTTTYLVNRGTTVRAVPPHHIALTSPSSTSSSNTKNIPDTLRRKAVEYILEYITNLHAQQGHNKQSGSKQEILRITAAMEQQVYTTAHTEADYLRTLGMRLVAIFNLVHQQPVGRCRPASLRKQLKSHTPCV